MKRENFSSDNGSLKLEKRQNQAAREHEPNGERPALEGESS